MKLFILIGTLFLLSSCLSTSISVGDYPEDDQTIAFAHIEFIDQVYPLSLNISKSDKHIKQSGDGRIICKNNENKVEAIFLNSGDYYYTYGYLGGIIFMLNDPKIEFNLETNKINYIGSFKMKMNHKDLIYKLDFNENSELYDEAVIEFKERFPELSKKYEFVNAVGK